MAATISISRLCDVCGVSWLKPGQTAEELVNENCSMLAELQPYGVEIQNRSGYNYLVVRIQNPGEIEEVEVYLGSDDPMEDFPDRLMHW